MHHFWLTKHSSRDYGLQRCKKQSRIKLSFHRSGKRIQIFSKVKHALYTLSFPFYPNKLCQTKSCHVLSCQPVSWALDFGQRLIHSCQLSCCPTAGQRSVCKEDTIPTLRQTDGRLFLVLSVSI